MTTAYAGRIKELRIKRVWSQEELATIADISVRTVQRIERGLPASPDTLKALSNAFEIDVTYLVQTTVAAPTTASGSIRLLQIRTGRDLFKLVGRAHLYRLDHGEIDAEMVDFVASFLQDVMDFADMPHVDPGDWIRIYSQFTSRIHELEE